MSFRSALALVAILEFTAILLGIINFGWTLEALQATARYSGRLSLILFSFIFLFVDSRFIKINNWLSDEFFLLFAVAHGIHLLELLLFLHFQTAPLIPYRLAGGILAYSLVFLMPLIQWRYDQQKLSAKVYRQLMLVYLYYVWFMFFMTYLPRVRGAASQVGGNYVEYVVLLGWVSIMMGFKLSQLIGKRR